MRFRFCLNTWNGVAYVDFAWTNREYVGIGAWSNVKTSYAMHFEIVIVHPCAVETHYTRVQWPWYTHLGLILMLIEYVERYRVGIGRTGSTLVLVHGWIQMCDYLMYDAL